MLFFPSQLYYRVLIMLLFQTVELCAGGDNDLAVVGGEVF